MTDTAFSDRQFSDLFPESIEREFWNLARNWIIESALPRGGRKLEIGCGCGIVVKHLLASGHEVWGAELATPALLSGVESRIFSGVSADALPESLRASIDCLLFLDVIEHIEDPPGFLRQMLAAYPNVKTVVFTVPARPEAWSNWDEAYGHKRRYTPTLLTDELLASGLRPAKIRYVFHSLYLAARLINLLGMKRTISKRPIRHYPLHRLVAWGLWLEARLLSPLRIIPGLSLLAIAERVQNDPQ
jgi:SAM-dependent methyltransferase